MSSGVSKEINDAPRLASKVYDLLMSPQFKDELCWDTLSDLKDKPTFKKAREYLNLLLTNQAEELPTLTEDKAASEYKKNIVAEICSVAYAIDTVFSKILFKRLENEYKAGIREVLKKLRDEGKISDADLAALQITSNTSIENSEENKEINSSKQEKETSTSVQVEEKSNSSNEDKIMQNHNYSTRRTAKSRKKIPQKLVAPESRSKGIQPRNQSTPKVNLSKESDSSKENAGTSKQNLSKESNAEENASTLKKKLSKESDSSKKSASCSNTDTQNIFCSSVWDDSEDSNSSSSISFGNISTSSASSVSSVHTSDLSSYDDEIILSDEDGTNKKMSFSEFMTHTNGPKLADKLNDTKLKASSNSLKKDVAEINHNVEIKQESLNSNSANEDCTLPQKIPDKLPESVHTQAPTSVMSTKRVRKPNSKYASENIFCISVKVKDRKKQNIDCTMDVDKEISSQLSPKKKRTRNDSSDTEVETPSKVQKKDVKKPTASDGKSPEKQSEISDLKKPQTSVRSLTSRRTAPVTLYSTA